PDIDNAAPAPVTHAGKGGLGHVEATAQVDPHHLVPVVEAHLGEHAVAGDARIVDDDVNGTKIGRDPRTSFDASVVIAHVPSVGCNTRCPGEGGGLFVIAPIIGGDGHALVAQHDADGLTNAACSTGNNCNSRHRLSPVGGPRLREAT